MDNGKKQVSNVKWERSNERCEEPLTNARRMD